MKLAIILEAYDNNLGQAMAKKYDVPPPELKSYVRGIDSDLNHGAWVLKALKGYLDGQGIKKWADFAGDTPAGDYKNAKEISTIINRLLTAFKHRQDELPEKDLNKYTISSLHAAIKALPEPVKREYVGDMPGARLLLKDGPFEAFEITDPKTLMHVSEGSSWCVKYESHAKSYLKKAAQIVIFKNGNATCLFASDMSEVKNSGNTDETRPDVLQIVKKAVFKLKTPEDIYKRLYKQTSFRHSDLRDLVLLTQELEEGKISGQQFDDLLDPQKLPQQFQEYLLGLPSSFNQPLFGVLAQTQDVDLYAYLARSFRSVKRPWPAMEAVILKMPLKTAYEYWKAVRLANGQVPGAVRWPELETTVTEYIPQWPSKSRSSHFLGQDIAAILHYWSAALSDWPEARAAAVDALRSKQHESANCTVVWLEALATVGDQSASQGALFDALATEFAEMVGDGSINPVAEHLAPKLFGPVAQRARERQIPFDVSQLLERQPVSPSWNLDMVLEKDRLVRESLGVTGDDWTWFFVVDHQLFFNTKTPPNVFNGRMDKLSEWAKENGVADLGMGLVFKDADIKEVYYKLSELLQYMQNDQEEAAYSHVVFGVTNGVASAVVDVRYDEDEHTHDLKLGRGRTVRDLFAKEMKDKNIRDYKETETYQKIGTLTDAGELKSDGSLNHKFIEMIVPRSVYAKYDVTVESWLYDLFHDYGPDRGGY
jgi:hypothetical protein